MDPRQQPASAPPLRLTLTMAVGNNQVRLLFSSKQLAAMLQMRRFLKEKLPAPEHYIEPKTYSINEYGIGWGAELPDLDFPQEMRLDFWFPNKYCIGGNAAIHANQQINLLIASVVALLPAPNLSSSSVIAVQLFDITNLKHFCFFYPPAIGEGIEIDLSLAKQCCNNFLTAIGNFKKFFHAEKRATTITTCDNDANFTKSTYIGIANIDSCDSLTKSNCPTAPGSHPSQSQSSLYAPAVAASHQESHLSSSISEAAIDAESFSVLMPPLHL